MDIKIYTVEGCFYCQKVKELCDRANLEYKSFKLHEDITKEAFNELYPGIEYFPYILVDGKVIGHGHLHDFAKWCLAEGHIEVKPNRPLY